MKLKKVFAAVLASSMLLLTGCGGSNNAANDATKKDGEIKDGGTITFAVGGDPKGLNPMYGNDRVTMTINNAIYSPLYVINDGKYEYYLADSMKNSEDYLHYTLKLKEGLKWDDGKPLTADDVVFTLDKIMDKSQNCMKREDFMIDDKPVQYKKVDDVTVEFTLPTLDMSFPSKLSDFAPIAKHVYEGETDISKSPKNDEPIGSGPYKFKEFKKGESVTLVRNDNYFGDKAHIDTVVYRVIPDANSSKSAFLSGEVSALYISPQSVNDFKDKANIITFDEGMNNNIIFMMKNPNLAKVEVRQAIAYALDKTELLKASEISTDYAELAYSVFTPDVPQFTNDVEKYDKNIDKAKELLKNAGVENIKLKLTYTTGDKGQETQALIIQKSLKEIGIDIELVPMERNAFIQKLFTPKTNDAFDIAFNGYVMGNDPSSYGSIFKTGGGNNFIEFSDDKVNELFNKANIETDSKKRDEIYVDIQKLLAEELPIYPICYPKSIVALDKKIGGADEAQPAPIFMFRNLGKLYIK